MDNHFETVVNRRTGKPIEGATITVQTEAGAIATIYSDNGATELENPLTSDADGFYNFYAADGRYTVTISGPGIDARSYSVLLEDPAEGVVTPSDGSVTDAKVAAGSKLKRRLDEVWATDPEFGVVADGVTDDSAALQAAANAAAGKRLVLPAGTYLASEINLASNTVVDGAGGAIIKLANPEKSAFIADSKTGVVVRDLKIVCEDAGTTAYVGGVKFAGSSHCKAVNVECVGLGWAGVLMYDSSYCTVENCRFSGWLGSIQDSADVTIYRNSNYNIVQSNTCGGGGDHGVFIQDPYTGSTPTGNQVINNRISGHKASGVIAYVTTAYDTQTLIAGNHIKNIQGTALSGQSGHGIYVQSAGGTVVTDNTITNCCVLTTAFETQVVAGIGIATGDLASYPTGTISEVIVSNNRIAAQRGPAIAVQTSGVPVSVSGNSIDSTGTEAVRGEAIYCANADGVQIKNNTIKHANPNYNAINIVASAAVLDGIEVVGNKIRGAVYGIAFNRTDGGSYANVVFANNVVKGVSGTAANLSAITGLVMTGNNLSSTGIVFILENCPNARLSGNRFASAYGTYSIIFTGSAGGNDGAVIDATNRLSGVVLHDAGTGGVIEQYASSAPSGSGFWAVGDRVINSAPAIGSPKGWSCTTAGNPGTWTSEGNL